MRRRSLMMPDELWATIHEEAAHESIEVGGNVSASALVRRAVEAYVSRPVAERVIPEFSLRRRGE